MISKLKAERLHAKRRYKERFNISLSRKQLNDIISNIQNGKDAIFLCKQSNNFSKWIVNVKGNKAIAVYDKNRKQIVTFLKLNNYQRINKEK